MAKAIEIDGVLYRKRRGKLVKIPDEWVGKTVGALTIRKRHSKTGAPAIYTQITGLESTFSHNMTIRSKITPRTIL